MGDRNARTGVPSDGLNTRFPSLKLRTSLVALIVYSMMLARNWPPRRQQEKR